MGSIQAIHGSRGVAASRAIPRSVIVLLMKEVFGIAPNGSAIDLYTLANPAGMRVQITNYGGIVTSLLVPDRKGQPGDVVLGFDRIDGYLKKHPYFGAICGRYANRIADGRFTLGG